MAASIFSLFGEIFIDNDKANKSIDTTTKKGSTLSDKLKTGFSAVGTAAAAVGTAAMAAGAAIYGMAQDAASNADAIDKQSQSLGLSIEGYQELEYVLGQNGAQISSMGTAFKNVLSGIDGSSKTAAEALQSLGIDTAGKNVEETFKAAVTALQGVEDETTKAALAQDVFGKSYQSLMPLLNQSAEDTEALTQRAHDLGIVMSEDAVSAGVTFGDLLDDLKRSFSAITKNIGSAVMPVVNKFLSLLIDNMPAIQNVISNITPILFSLAEQIFPVFADLANAILPQLLSVVFALLPPIQSIISNLLPVLADVIAKILPRLVDIVNRILPPLATLIDVILTQGLLPIIDAVLPILFDLIDMILPVLMQIIETILPVLTTVLQDALLPMMLMLVDIILPTWQDLLSALLPQFLEIVTAILPALVALLEILVPILQFVTDKIMPVLGEAFKFVAGIMKTVFGEAIRIIVDSIQFLVDQFNVIIDFVKDVFAGNWEKAWQTLIDRAKVVWGKFGGIIKTPINEARKIINSFISGLNKLKIPDWIPAIGGQGVNIPLLPMLAEGGTITKAGSAIVGEAGPELVNLPRGASVEPLRNAGITLNITNFYNNRAQDVKEFAEELEMYRYQAAIAHGGL